MLSSTTVNENKYFEHQIYILKLIIHNEYDFCNIWSNEDLVLPSQQWITFKKILKYKTVILNCNNISQYYCFYFIFDQLIIITITIIACLVNIKSLKIKNKNKSYQPQKFDC